MSNRPPTEPGPVLVVDDDPLVGAEICRALRRHGLEAWHIQDPSLAARAAQQLSVFAVVVDEMLEELVDARSLAMTLARPLVLLRFEASPHAHAVVIGGPRWLEELVEHLVPEAALIA